ncbi:hypothetical protein P2G74_01440 [Cronobacter muytjensii]|uniref:hypothetical protein n=1 Tax=Cronobacter muytjensii TaxID=413501 RepID=UPI002DBA0061|nr:hypothetical protein [Cronobacter muytjensii]MEB8638636.1 hypothetical protein [Cronobacter muytjensii]
MKYLLCVWGSAVAGNTGPGAPENVIGRMMMRTRWDERSARRIVAAVQNLWREGLRGQQLYDKARHYLFPQTSACAWIDEITQADDAAFIERLILRTVTKKSPIYVVALQRYVDGRRVSSLAQEISLRTGCDLQAARKRVTWCEKVLEEEIFFAAKRELEKEKHVLQQSEEIFIL